MLMWTKRKKNCICLIEPNCPRGIKKGGGGGGWGEEGEEEKEIAKPILDIDMHSGGYSG